MLSYTIRRVAQGIVVLLLLTFVTFALQHALPGGAARGLLGPRATPEQVRAFEHTNRLDEPLVPSYVHYLGRLLHGDLGRSIRLDLPVRTVIANDGPRDIVLVGGALVLSLVIGIPLGLLQAIGRERLFDRFGTAAASVAYAVPSFTLGLIAIALFAVHFG